jgi:hypothetical protein
VDAGMNPKIYNDTTATTNAKRLAALYAIWTRIVGISQMTSQILSYRRAADPATVRQRRRAWMIVAIYVLPVVVPFCIWTGAALHDIVAHPSAIVRPLYFALSAAAGPFCAGMMPLMAYSIYPAGIPLPWTWFHPMDSSPEPPIVGGSCLIAWSFVVTLSSVMRWPIWVHLLISAAWWSSGYATVLSGCWQGTIILSIPP